MSPLSPLHTRGRAVRNLSFFIVLSVMFAAAASWHIPESSASQRGGETISQPPVDQGTIARSYGELPLSFERNDGQSDHNVKFLSRAPGFDIFLTSSGAVLTAMRNSSRLKAARRNQSHNSTWK